LFDIFSDAIEMRVLERKAARKSKANHPVEDGNGNTTAPQKLCAICGKSGDISDPCAECLLLMNDDLCVRQTSDPDYAIQPLEASNSLRTFKEVSAADAADVRRSITQAHNQFIFSLKDAESNRQFDNHNGLIPERELSKKVNLPSIQRPNRMRRVVKSNAQQSAGHDDEVLSASCSVALNSSTAAGVHALPVPSNEHKQQDGADDGNSLRSMAGADSAGSIATAGVHALPVPSNERRQNDAVDESSSLRSMAGADSAASIVSAGVHALPVSSNQHKQTNSVDMDNSISVGVLMAVEQWWIWGF